MRTATLKVCKPLALATLIVATCAALTERWLRHQIEAALRSAFGTDGT